MHFLKYYNKTIVQYDLINKFTYKNLKNLPKLKFIVVQVCFKKYELKKLITSLAALELITNKKGIIIKSKTTNISLKVRKGYPIGCKVILTHIKMYQFLEKLINNFIITLSSNVLISAKTSYNLFSFKIKSILTFIELEKNYRFFNRLNNMSLNISIGTNTLDYEQFIFLLRSYKITILKKKFANVTQ